MWQTKLLYHYKNCNYLLKVLERKKDQSNPYIRFNCGGLELGRSIFGDVCHLCEIRINLGCSTTEVVGGSHGIRP